MTATVLDIKLTYENAVSLDVKARTDSGDWKTIVEMEENGHIGLLWTHIQAICTDYFRAELDDIGAVMKG